MRVHDSTIPSLIYLISLSEFHASAELGFHLSRVTDKTHLGATKNLAQPLKAGLRPIFHINDISITLSALSTRLPTIVKWSAMPSEPIAGSKKAQKIRQACDCCHARKIRCDGEKPCKNCQITELQCTYLAIPKKKGPKGRRIAKDVKPVPIQRPRIFEHASNGPPATTREQQPIDTASRGTETNDFSLFNILNPTPNVLSPESGPTVASSSTDDNASTFRASPLLSADLVKTCLDAFFTHKYPIMPVLDKDITYAMIPHLNEMPEQYGMVAALCALIVFQPEIIDAPQLGSPWPSSQDLINEAVRARGFCDHIEKPSLTSIHTAFFLYAALFCLGKDNSAWFYIRESMTMLQILRLHEEGTYQGLDSEYSKFCRRSFWLLFITERGYALQRHRPLTLQLTIALPTVCLGKDNSAWFYIRESMTMLQILRLHEEGTYQGLDSEYSKFCRRSFWLLFITERGYALQRHRPLTLQLTIALPTVDPGPEATILSGFLDLVSLFQHFDESFMTLWNMSGSDSSPQALIQLQEILKTAIPDGSDRTEIQQADLRVSRQWLRTLVWQLCVSKGFLSSQSSDESMSFQYPISIARDVVQVARSLPVKAFEANGVGLLEKVFDIGCSLSDVLLLNPDAVNSSSMEIGPRDYLLEMVRLLGTTPGGDKYLRMLTLKSDGFMQLRLRGSLSDSEASDRIEEVFDDEETAIPDQGNVQYPGYGETVIEGDFNPVDQLGAGNFEVPPVSMMMGDPSLAFSMPTPGWDAFWPPSAPDVD